MQSKVLTVIDLEDWSLLFDGDKLASQSHSTTIDDLISVSKGFPFCLWRVCADGSKLDKKVTEDGDVSLSLSLAEALPMTARG